MGVEFGLSSDFSAGCVLWFSTVCLVNVDFLIVIYDWLWVGLATVRWFAGFVGCWSCFWLRLCS